ncbi:unnamed protein product [Blepharisma stoltei]|uniref:DNA-directed RNA polymerase subunit n=1 Tax=Blepharisma stoltei TaxID=1481888 RepID=A0AAU9K900_9CILI|nr:unnamed protein product [Blepharisma stoltei]|mmetsp:Transcript_5032/g.4953  ORF Transcript_5032/g.4953 Transcript_5032/m.4953 type:complete len:107 (+) Transcript_5032:8-328(+)
MLFCPSCANCLLVDQREQGTQFFCKTCPYVFSVNQKRSKRVMLERKQVDDVLGGPNEWVDVAQIDAVCPKCGELKAYYKQIQIRSADEPMTVFYKCVRCAHRWNEN